MTPNVLNTKTPPDAKTGIDMLMKPLDKHAQTSQPIEEVPFARILDEKTAQIIIPSDSNGSTRPIIGKPAPADTEDASNPEMPVPPQAAMIVVIRQMPALTTPELQDATLPATMEQKAVQLAGKTGNIPLSSQPGMTKAVLGEASTPLNQATAGGQAGNIPLSSQSGMTKAVLGETSDPLHQAAADDQAGKMVTGEESTVMTSSTVTTATADSSRRDVMLSSDSPAASHVPEEQKGRQAEAGFLNRVAEVMQQKNNGPAGDSILADIRRVHVSAEDPRYQPSLTREAAVRATEIQKPVVAETVNDKGAGMRQAASESTTKVELPDQAVFMKNTAPAVADPARDHEQSRNASKIKGSEQDSYPFPMKTATVYSSIETRAAAAGGPSGTQTQAIINQILDAKQAMSSDFGRVRIVLEPPNLGTIDLEIIVRRERVEVVMTADNAGVQQTLQSRSDDIRSALQRQDLKIENFQVLLQDNGAGQQQANSGAMYEQRRKGWERLNAAEEHILALPVLPSMEGSGPATGQLSVFA